MNVLTYACSNEAWLDASASSIEFFAGFGGEVGVFVLNDA